jgi:catechol 2,3-dioxygenase-like lactoylglutathione lyase family enzyme
VGAGNGAGRLALILRVARAIGINHVALDVGSVTEALDFWRALFPGLQLRGQSPTMAFIDLGDQFVALSEHAVGQRSEHRHFGLVVDDVAAVLAAAREQGASIRGNSVGDPWGNRFDVVAYSEVQFTKVEPVLRAQKAADLEKSDEALAELREKGIDL